MLRLAIFLALGCASFAQSSQSATAQPGEPGPAVTLYRRISNLGLDPKLVFNVRDAAIDREDIHISFEDGTLAFTEEINGHITGALFDGEGTVLIVPPNQVERHSLGMFTQSAVLNQKFTKAYFRFDDSRFLKDLKPYLQPLEEAAEFVDKQNTLAKTMSATDSLRLLVALTRDPNAKTDGPLTGEFIHAHFVGESGLFDASWDTGLNEQIGAGQESFTDHGAYYDQWMSFPMRSVRLRDAKRHEEGLSNDELYADQIQITDYKIRTNVVPPTDISVDATLSVTVNKSGDRALIFELSRHLKLSSVTLESGGLTVPLEFIQNEALEGTQLAKRGNDLTAIVLPKAMAAGERFKLHFNYAGAVLSAAGSGLLYVGARGAWFPNRGPMMSNFELEFESPVPWKLLATGKLQSQNTHEGVEDTQWVSERPIPFAGFNLGQYTSATAKSNTSEAQVTAYATSGVEKTFPTAPPPTELVIKEKGRPPITVHTLPAAAPPDPSEYVKTVAERARDTIDFLSARLGPYPYSSLMLTQMPGPDSQGWPGLVFLSSHVFLTPAQRGQGRDENYAKSAEEIIYGDLMEAHETGHQWWGDTVLWQSYRDQWLMEALANYGALLEIEAKSPEKVHTLLSYYRKELETPAPAGTQPRKEAGPVSFGLRLNSGPFPGSYETVAYGRGTWLIHMLRHMLRDADLRPSTKSAQLRRPASKEPKDPDQLFLSVLRNIQKKFAGKIMSTQDLQLALEEVWPEQLRFEGKKSLDWFFDGWVNGTGIPKIELKEVKITMTGGKNTAHANLVQVDAPDSLVTSVPIYAQTSAGLVFVDRVFADGNETLIKLTVPAGTKKLVVDPYETVLAVK